MLMLQLNMKISQKRKKIATMIMKIMLLMRMKLVMKIMSLIRMKITIMRMKLIMIMKIMSMIENENKTNDNEIKFH